MEETADILDDMVDLDYCEEEDSNLRSKFKNITQADADRPFYVGSSWTRTIVQGLSIVLGFGMCLHMADKFSSIREIIFVLCVGVLVLIELGKRKAIDKANAIRIINRTKKSKRKLSSLPYKLSGFFFLALSLGSGYVGSEEVIKYYSEHKDLISLDSIKVNFDRQIQAVSADLGSSSTFALALADSLHKQSNYKGVTSRSVRKEKAALVVLGAETESIKNNSILDLKDKLHTSILTAEKENKEVIADHEEWCKSFAWWAVLFVVIFDFVVVVLSYWMANHEASRIAENKAKERLKEIQEESVKQGVNDNEEEKDSLLTDGEIKSSPSGQTSVITVRLTDGTLKKYKSGPFRSYYNSSSPSRQKALRHYLEDLDQFESPEE